ncbi:trypsin-like peptidase domain-containing protein [Pseudoxanthomonas mexicana]|uniref:Trypsin-like peptidase domain-containing protein n=1 Tax=Pseudoxanthomonas mexicana TaxID=128785 RepID=A0A7G9TAY4_PSEMX|nr:serine protease [Pseudoxanthomonas mexicana]QNN77259.1 trypsin-like peptidase domain-containing protein [Pseudoxanthomonas mexicana]
MITSNVYNRVFFIKAADYGTAFAIDHNDKQYLVTARHLVDSSNQRTIKFFFNRQWVDIEVELIGLGSGETDIAVFRANVLLCTKELFLEPSSKDMAISQDVYFVGYPYKMWTDAGNSMNGRPCPFVKKGILSSAFVGDDGVPRMYVDALNNPGFSGGPIVFQPPSKTDFKVAGIVSKFKIEFEQVIDPDGDHTEMTVAYNTGFLIGYDISKAIEIIDRNPNGLPIPQQV